LTISENNRCHLGDFIRFNEEWISTYFEIEDVDRNSAADSGQIIDKGGYIFSLVEIDAPDGTAPAQGFNQPHQSRRFLLQL
jgi:hypothetical protein